MSSNQSGILLATKSTIDGLTLSLNNQLLSSFIKKWPTREEGIEPAAGLYIYVDQKGKKTVPWATGADGVQINNVRYPVNVALVAPNNRDQVSGLDEYGTIQEAIADAFKNKLPYASVPDVFDANVIDAPFLPREAIPVGYDIIEQTILVDTAE